MKKMEKEVINRGYLTYALTDGDKKIFGRLMHDFINIWDREAKHFYWSEVFVDGSLKRIIRKGMLLVNPTNEELSLLHAQSKVNLDAK